MLNILRGIWSTFDEVSVWFLGIIARNIKRLPFINNAGGRVTKFFNNRLFAPVRFVFTSLQAALAGFFALIGLRRLGAFLRDNAPFIVTAFLIIAVVNFGAAYLRGRK